jgi:uncharacterized protein (TIGR02118 family)
MAIHTTRVGDRDPHLVDRAQSRRALGKHVAGAALGAALVRLGGGTAAGGASPAGVGRGREQQKIVRPSLQRIVVDDTELEYAERGSGEPVLLIHGSVLANAFAPVLTEPALTDRYRVINYHRRGFAGSARPEGEVSIARQAADARAVLAHLGITQAHVVGYSYGALIALQLAFDAPDTVHSLALLEPPLFSVPSGEQFIATVFAPAVERYGTGDRAGAVETVLRGVAGGEGLAALQGAVPGALALAETDADTFFQTELPALQAWRFGADEAGRIGPPVLAVRGADSDMVAPVFGEGIAQLRGWLPQAETLVVPAATHGLPFMNPRALAEGLAAFFARHPLEPQLASPATAGPVKLVALYGVPTDAAAFERYYAATHVPLARQLPGLKRVETARLLGTAEGGTAPYHRIAELWFADMESFQAAATSAEGRALTADVANFATGGLTVLVAQVDAADAAVVPAAAER